MLPSAVRNGLKANLEAIKGMRVYELIPTVPVAPAAVVGQLDFTFDLNNARGLDQANLDEAKTNLISTLQVAGISQSRQQLNLI